MKTKPQVGQQVKCHGLDMKCKKTVEIYRIVKVYDPPIKRTDKNGNLYQYDCVIEAIVSPEGVRVLSDSSSFIKP